MVYKPEFVEHVTRRRAALRAEAAALIPAGKPVVLEIGCGHGHFLETYARQYPQRHYIGVDLRGERIEKARKKARRAGLTNCHFVRAEAREFLQSLPPEVTFAEIWVLFPDPWPKKRHHKHRLLQPAFLEYLAGRVGKGGRLYYRTDHREYFAEVAAFLPTLSTWRIDPRAPWPLEHETVFQARAPSYQSLVAVRTSHPAKPAETADPLPPAPADPT
ncbi:MAG: tRNA (guanosine(46)-N7)-methyltransferase TrmB [Opitutaceae bacterium]|nr:tRNA (guanosine(46)-N7)-methyltransferase TrmB [Opitutaceae bacterium]